MKRTILIAALLVTVIGSAIASGNDNQRSENIKLIKGEDQVHYLIYPFAEPGNVRVKFLNEKGKVVGSDRVRNARGFKKGYDLSKLAPGDYSVQIRDENGTMTKSFEIQNDITVAILRMTNQRYRLIVDSKEPGEVGVKIFDKAGDLVYKDNQDGSFTRVYDLSQIDSDKFSFQLSANGNTHIINAK